MKIPYTIPNIISVRCIKGSFELGFVEDFVYRIRQSYIGEGNCVKLIFPRQHSLVRQTTELEVSHAKFLNRKYQEFNAKGWIPGLEAEIVDCSTIVRFHIVSVGLTPEARSHDNKASDRQYYHELLDRAMNTTKEGDSFLPTFMDLILKELVIQR